MNMTSAVSVAFDPLLPWTVLAVLGAIGLVLVLLGLRAGARGTIWRLGSLVVVLAALAVEVAVLVAEAVDVPLSFERAVVFCLEREREQEREREREQEQAQGLEYDIGGYREEMKPKECVLEFLSYLEFLLIKPRRSLRIKSISSKISS